MGVLDDVERFSVDFPRPRGSSKLPFYHVNKLYNYISMATELNKNGWAKNVFKIRKHLTNFSVGSQPDGNLSADDVKMVMGYLESSLEKRLSFSPEELKNSESNRMDDNCLPMCLCGLPCSVEKGRHNKLYWRCVYDTSGVNNRRLCMFGGCLSFGGCEKVGGCGRTGGCGLKVRCTKTEMIPLHDKNSRAVEHYLKNSPWLFIAAELCKMKKLKNCRFCQIVLYKEFRVVYQGNECNVCWNCLASNNTKLMFTYMWRWKMLNKYVNYGWSVSAAMNHFREMKKLVPEDGSLYDPCVDEE